MQIINSVSKPLTPQQCPFQVVVYVVSSVPFPVVLLDLSLVTLDLQRLPVWDSSGHSSVLTYRLPSSMPSLLKVSLSWQLWPIENHFLCKTRRKLFWRWGFSFSRWFLPSSLSHCFNILLSCALNTEAKFFHCLDMVHLSLNNSFFSINLTLCVLPDCPHRRHPIICLLSLGGFSYLPKLMTLLTKSSFSWCNVPWFARLPPNL